MISKLLELALLVLAISSGPAVRAEQGIAAHEAKSEPCSRAGGIDYVCGIPAPEDIVALDGTPWAIASSYVDGGGLYLVHRHTRELRRAFPPAMASAPALHLGCRAAAPQVLKTHGLAVQTLADGKRRLLVVNHGEEESIEVFDVYAGKARPELRWAGCLRLPKPMIGNSVVGLRDGSIIFSEVVSAANGRPPQVNLLAGDPSGALWLWRDGQLSRLNTPPVSGPAGLVTSADERWLFISSWADQRVWRVELAGREAPVSVAIDFHPDNLRRDGGHIVAAGQAVDLNAYFACAASATRPAYCAEEMGVAFVDGATMALLGGTRTRLAGYGDVTVALPMDGKLWLGSVGETDRIVIVDQPPIP